jgi:hypothetical protein
MVEAGFLSEISCNLFVCLHVCRQLRGESDPPTLHDGQRSDVAHESLASNAEDQLASLRPAHDRQGGDQNAAHGSLASNVKDQPASGNDQPRTRPAHLKQQGMDENIQNCKKKR